MRPKPVKTLPRIQKSNLMRVLLKVQAKVEEEQACLEILKTLLPEEIKLQTSGSALKFLLDFGGQNNVVRE